MSQSNPLEIFAKGPKNVPDPRSKQNSPRLFITAMSIVFPGLPAEGVRANFVGRRLPPLTRHSREGGNPGTVESAPLETQHFAWFQFPH